MIAEKIKHIRIGLGMSMEEFASRIDSVAKSGTVANWETGKNKPNNARLKRIAELGGIGVEELVNEKTNNTFHKMISQLRNDKGLTQKQLGELIGKKESTVRMWELDKSEPTLSTLIRLADIFDVALDELVGRDK